MWTGCCVECLTAAIYSGARFDMGVGVSLCGWVPVFGVFGVGFWWPPGQSRGTWVHGAR